ncbi:hypothetical protein C8046_08465 [Serinibacter arcticus]|uniref:Uncharacterized protein n=1 Tax=Serinibacter arcticus TaxID=1655435 RepID=A0A2U1ZUT1_9MICO|nr:hypothetical protein [Serinibacter arcticus]PWD50682.1 hypothetical protein C8046_08465 [Serinibacter arcticus]
MSHDELEEPSWFERVGQQVEVEAQEPDDDVHSQQLEGAGWRLDGALADGDSTAVEDEVGAVLSTANEICEEDELIGRAVAVRLWDDKGAWGSVKPTIKDPDPYEWGTLFEDEHGWDDDDDQETVRAEHDREQSADAIRHYVSAIGALYGEARGAATSGETRTVIAALAKIPAMAVLLDDAHELWRQALSTLMKSDPQLAGPAADFYATALGHSLAVARAADATPPIATKVEIDDGGLFAPPASLL